MHGVVYSGCALYIMHTVPHTCVKINFQSNNKEISILNANSRAEKREKKKSFKDRLQSTESVKDFLMR